MSFLGLIILSRKEASKGRAAVKVMAPIADENGNGCRKQHHFTVQLQGELQE